MNGVAAVGAERLFAEPFLKWAGGKRQLLPELRPHVPVKFGRYFEPFAGGAAMFFDVFSDDGKKAVVHKLGPARAVLGDSNDLLMATYLAVRDNVDSVCAELRGHKLAHSANPKEHYYATRKEKIEIDWKDWRGSSGPWASQTADEWARSAARTIYLNRTCFNGLWRALPQKRRLPQKPVDCLKKRGSVR